LLLFHPEDIISQDSGNYSEFRKEIAALTINYKFEEALALCNNSDGSDREVVAAKSVNYSLLGNSYYSSW